MVHVATYHVLLCFVIVGGQFSIDAGEAAAGMLLPKLGA